MISVSGMEDGWGVGWMKTPPQNAPNIYLIHGQSCQGPLAFVLTSTDHVTQYRDQGPFPKKSGYLRGWDQTGEQRRLGY